MLLRITDYCRMGCPHCFNNCTEQGQHMTRRTLTKSVSFINKIKPKLLMVSGGEPTDHPDFIEFITYIIYNAKISMLMIASNGMFVENDEITNFLTKKRDILVQVINDPKYYPHRVKHVLAENIQYMDTIPGGITPLGRAVTNNLPAAIKSPGCFNMRSLCNNFNDLKKSISYLETRGNFCKPSVNIDGTVTAGESNQCTPIGHVSDSLDKLCAGIKNSKCNNCGLVDNLDMRHKAAINLL